MADTRATETAREEKPALRIERHYPVAPEKVWRAWTDPQALSAWFGPGAADSVQLAQVDLRVGGRFRVLFYMPDGMECDISGSYREVQPPHKLVFTWAWKGTPERVSLVTIRLAAAAGGTRMDFLHEQFYDEAARDDHRGGWSRSFDKLGQHLGAP